jgi:hypothetical protein
MGYLKANLASRPRPILTPSVARGLKIQWKGEIVQVVRVLQQRELVIVFLVQRPEKSHLSRREGDSLLKIIKLVRFDLILSNNFFIILVPSLYGMESLRTRGGRVFYPAKNLV